MSRRAQAPSPEKAPPRPIPGKQPDERKNPPEQPPPLTPTEPPIPPSIEDPKPYPITDQETVEQHCARQSGEQALRNRA